MSRQAFLRELTDAEEVDETPMTLPGGMDRPIPLREQILQSIMTIMKDAAEANPDVDQPFDWDTDEPEDILDCPTIYQAALMADDMADELQEAEAEEPAASADAPATPDTPEDTAAPS